MFKLIVISCLASLALGGFVDPLLPDGRIVGGKATTIEQYPHQISLLSYGRHNCGGSIISSTWVLTAAHCVVYASPSSQSVRVGSSDYNANGVVIQVKRLIPHPKYGLSAYDYDYALIELAEPIEFGPGAQAISLPQQGEEVADGSITEVSGWGALSSGGSAPKVLQVVEVPVVSQSKCIAAYGSSVTDRMICAGVEEGGKDSCQGDSGGPMIQGGKLIGVVSWGRGCAARGYPGVYARVAAQRDWIKEVSGV